MTEATIAVIVGAGVTMFTTLLTFIISLVQILKTKGHVKRIEAKVSTAQQNRQRGSSTPGNRPIGTETARDSDARTRRSD